MSDNYETNVHNMTVERCMSENNAEHEVGEILSVTVEVCRREVRAGGSVRRNRTVTYDVGENGIAQVRSVEPTYPKSNSTVGRMEPKHLAPIMVAADASLPGAVPEVESVWPLNGTLRNERSKHEEHPDEMTGAFEDEQVRADGGSE